MIGENICQAAYILRCLWLGCLLFFASPLIAQISLPHATDKPVTQKISGSEQKVYQIVLAAEEYLHLNVVYQGLIVAVTINDLNGKPLSESGGGVDTVATAEIAIIAPAAGIYQLTIQGRGAAADKGSYKLEVKALRPATDQDRLYATAQRTTLEGNRLYNLRTVESRRQALGKFQEALQLWRVSQELRKEIEVLDRIGVIHLLLGETRRAQELAQEMLSKSRQAGVP